MTKTIPKTCIYCGFAKTLKLCDDSPKSKHCPDALFYKCTYCLMGVWVGWD